MRVFVAVPIPRPFRQPEIVNNPRLALVPRDAAVVKSAPQHLAAAPRIPPEKRLRLVARPLGQIPPRRPVFPRPHGAHRTVFGDQIRNARINIQPRPVAIVTRHVTQLVQSPALAPANARRARRVQFMRFGHEVRQQRPHLWQHRLFAEEHLVAHAPGHDGRMVAIDPNHVAQTVAHRFLEGRLIVRRDRVGAGIPKAFRRPSAHAPKTVFRPEHHAQLVARLRKRRRVRIMRAANELEPRLLHQIHIPVKPAVRHRVTPARMILMHVRPLEVKVAPIQKESLIRRPFEPPETEAGFKMIGRLVPVAHLADRRVEIRMIRVPEPGIRHRRGGLVERDRRARRHRLRGADAPRHLAAGIEDVRPQPARFCHRAVIADFGFHVHRAGFRRDRRRGHKRAIPRDVQRFGDHQPHVAVKAAAENVLARARGEPRIPVVVQPHRHHIIPRFHRVRNVHRKSRVAALVFREPLSVQENLRILKRPVELQEQPLARPIRRRCEVLAIPTIARVKPRRAKVRQAERMRQANLVPPRVIKRARRRAGMIPQLKLPLPVEVQHLPRRIRRPQQSSQKQQGQQRRQ